MGLWRPAVGRLAEALRASKRDEYSFTALEGETDGEIASHEKNSGAFGGARRRGVNLGLRDAAAAECACRRRARRGYGRSHWFGSIGRQRGRGASGRRDRGGLGRAHRLVPDAIGLLRRAAAGLLRRTAAASM